MHVNSGRESTKPLQLASDYVPTVPTLGSLRNLLRSIEFEHLTLVHSTATGSTETVHERLQQPREDTAARASRPRSSVLAKLNPAKGAATKHTLSHLRFVVNTSRHISQLGLLGG